MSLLTANLCKRRRTCCDLSHWPDWFVRMFLMSEQGNVVSALGAASLFSNLSPEELGLLAAHAVRKRYALGELLYG